MTKCDIQVNLDEHVGYVPHGQNCEMLADK